MSKIFENVKYRMLIFMIVCIGARLSLAYLARVIPNDFLIVFSSILGLIGLSFLFLYLTGYRKIGTETGGKPIWWNTLRPIHGILYLAAAAVLIDKQRLLSSQLLIFDTLIGLTAFVIHHIKQGDFQQLG